MRRHGGRGIPLPLSSNRERAAFQAFRFLDLHPEVRNRVYEFARGPEFGWKQHGKRGYMHLTQVCRQIRAEFRPIWLGRIAVKISDDQLQQYLSIFFSTYMAMGSRAVRSSIVIYTLNNWAKRSTNLLSILRLVAYIPLVQINVAEQVGGSSCLGDFAKELDIIFEYREKWTLMLQQDCDKLIVQRSAGNVTITGFAIQMSQQFAAKWINGVGGIEVSEAVTFLSDLGFFRRGEASFPVLLGIHNKGPVGGVCWHRVRGY